MNKAVLALIAFAAFAVQALAAEEKTPSWTERLTIKGDFRLRDDYLKQDDDSSGAGGYTRNRLRIRARLALEANVNDEVKGVIGITTDEKGSPVSADQTLGEDFTKKSIYLDLAYAEWKPSAISDLGVGGITLDGGKMRNPFLMVSELIWDPDVTPEGLVARYVSPESDRFEALANGGALWYYERKADPETMLYVGQVGLKFKNRDGYSFLLGGSCYYFNRVAGYNAFDYQAADAQNGCFYGNSKVNQDTTGATTNYVYADEYHEVEGMAALGFPCPLTKLPWKIYFDCVRNTDPSDDNLGYQTGIQLNDLQRKGDFLLAYAYRKLEKDATMGAMTESTWWGGGTDGQGHQIRGGYQLLENWSLLATWYFKNEFNLDAPVDYTRLQIDLLARF